MSLKHGLCGNLDNIFAKEVGTENIPRKPNKFFDRKDISAQQHQTKDLKRKITDPAEFPDVNK